MAIIGSPNDHCCFGFVFFRFSMPPIVVAVVVVVVGGGGVVGVVVVVTAFVDFSASQTCCVERL